MPRPNGADVWRRDPGAPFDDAAREDYAKARAKGGTIKACANHVGIGAPTATAWEKHPEMRGRIRELRQGAEDFVGVSVGWVIQELKRNVEEARENGQLKSSNEALKLIYDIVRTDPDIANKMARSLPPTVSTRSIKKQLLASLQADALPAPVDTEGEPVEREEEDDAAE